MSALLPYRPDPVEVAIRFAVERGWPVFPCREAGPDRKKPYTTHGFYDATLDIDQIVAWFSRWPDALVATPTGRANGHAASGLTILDIDVKPGKSGFDALEELGRAILPDTWMTRTPRGGTHVYFAAGDVEVPCSAGKLGPGLDVRSAGGYIILPGCGGYRWDEHHHPKAGPLAAEPGWLIAEPEPQRLDPGPRPAVRQPLGRYGEAALDRAVHRIVSAPAGEQQDTLNTEVYSIAGLVAGGVIPSALALESLHWAAQQLHSHDPRRPWRVSELRRMVDRAFLDGLRQPRRPEQRR